jgi:hypothetical protein
MAANDRYRRWGWFTDMLALRGNADDEFKHILKHSREPHIIEAAGRGRRELERLRQGLISARDGQEELPDVERDRHRR